MERADEDAIKKLLYSVQSSFEELYFGFSREMLTRGDQGVRADGF